MRTFILVSSWLVALRLHESLPSKCLSSGISSSIWGMTALTPRAVTFSSERFTPAEISFLVFVE